MNAFDVQAVEIQATPERVFDFVADAGRLPEWTLAFKEVHGRRARMETPAGSVEVDLEVRAQREQGTVDWLLTFPDGSRAAAFSRVVPAAPGRSVYSFVLLPPPVPLEQLEGTLAEQSRTLREELGRLQILLAAGG